MYEIFDIRFSICFLSHPYVELFDAGRENERGGSQIGESNIPNVGRVKNHSDLAMCEISDLTT